MTSKKSFLLSIDALRPDHLPAYGYAKDTAPFLTELAEENTLFTNAYASSTHTPEAVPSILTGKYPDHFSENNFDLVTKSVPQLLGENDVLTAGINSNLRCSRIHGYHTHFDYFFDDLIATQNEFLVKIQRFLKKHIQGRDLYAARADRINNEILSWIDSIDGQSEWFMWAHYMDPHNPYCPPRGYRNGISKQEIDKLNQKYLDDPDATTEHERKVLEELYDLEIQYLDDKLRELFKELEQRGILDEMVIYIISDHGEAFWENGLHNHPRVLDDLLLHIPLIVVEPNSDGKTISTPVSAVDLAPTILESFGIKCDLLPGTSLDKVEPDSDRVVFSQVVGEERTGNSHLRRYSARNKAGRYTIEVNRNNGEITAEDGGEESLRQTLVDHIESRDNVVGSHQVSTKNVSSHEVESRLESLGYK
ncbi:MAG: sulfatase [Halobacteriaceae archaeon]